MDKLVLVGIGHPLMAELSLGLNRLGRNPTNDFRISDSTVSSFHCEIDVTDGVVTVTDLRSTNGTYINGQPVTEAELRPGQILRLGSAEFRLEAYPLEEVHVAIPELTPPPAAPQPQFLEDGTPACLNHGTVEARFRCKKCENVFCLECVRLLKLSGGKARYYCTSCTGQCEKLAPAGKGQKISL